jgi:signal transduction histidine kinase
MPNELRLFTSRKAIWLMVSVVLLPVCLLWQKKLTYNTIENVETAYISLQQIIHEKELMLEHAGRIASARKGHVEQLQEMLRDYSMNQQVFVQVFKGDSIVAWNNNLLNIRDHLDEISSGTGVYKGSNGWYLVHRIDSGNRSFFSYFLIKKEYPFQNDYLQNEFNPELQIPSSGNISLVKTEGYRSINSVKGKKLFYINIHVTAPEPSAFNSVISWFCIALFLLTLFRWSMAAYRSHYVITLFTEIVLLLLLRAAMTVFEFPYNLYRSPLFDSVTYGSSLLLPSLGDVLLNSLLFCLLCYRVSGWIKQFSSAAPFTYSTHPKKSTGIAFIAQFVIILISAGILAVCRSVILDSNLLFDVSTIYLTGWNYLVSVTIIGVVIFGHMLITHALVQLILSIQVPVRKLLPYTAIFIICLLAFEAVIGNHNAQYLSLVFMYMLCITAAPFLIRQFIWYQKALGIIIIISLFASSYIFYWNTEKEKENRKLYAFKLVNRNDVNAEYYFGEVEHKIADDPLIRDYFQNSIILKQQMERYVKQNYFSGYVGRYDISLYDYDSVGNSYKEFNNLSFTEIDSVYKYNSVITVDRYFRHIQSSPDIQGYLARFAYGDSLHPTGVLFLLLQPKIIQEENRFDELLSEGRNSIRNKNELYSYALYNKRKLLSKSGDYAYPIRLPQIPVNGTYTFYTESGYSHLLFSNGDQTDILISRKQNQLNEQIAIFSVLFVSFTTIVLVFFALLTFFSIILSYAEQHFSAKQFTRRLQKLFSSLFPLSDFRLNLISTKIQVSIIIIVFPTLLFTFYFTIDSMIKKYEKAQTERVARKMRNVINAIENDPRIRINNLSVSDLALFTHQVAEFNNTDINLYDLKGQLITTTTSRIYDAGIVAPLMNINAFYALRIQERSQVFLNEEIGNLKFMAAYAPVLDNRKNVVAYLNLPYFVKKSELYSEVTSLFISIINTYVIAFITVIIIIYIISRNIAAPLNLIRNKMAATSLGGKNEQIDWKGNDEIAQLVLQYNTMIDELARSAEKLARSEREDAWREMAKQVAHEIKNPLTPMKLSVQHLQRAWKDQSPNLEETFKRVTSVLIEQIDSMSLLATEFSSFAKLPSSQFIELNAIEILQSVVDLYSEENVELHVSHQQSTVMILLDKDQLMRVFNNLIKNAIQAIPDDRAGRIQIHSEVRQSELVVCISDNGTGITVEEQQNIFLPNFSTKTSGMGMGLAIVKNIVESAGGDIYFETKAQQGTTFYVHFPIVKHA